jgi:hypothetical protein
VPRRSLHCPFRYAADATPAAPLAASLVSFSCRRPLAPPLAISLVFLTGQPLAYGAARCIAPFFLPPTPRSPHRSLSRLFFSPANLLPAAPLAESLVSFSRRRHAGHATRCITRFCLQPSPLTAEPLAIQNIQKNEIKKSLHRYPKFIAYALSPPTHKWTSP